MPEANVPALKMGGGLVSREALVGNLNRMATSIPSVGGDHQYLKMDKKDGVWEYGQDRNEIAANDLFAVNPLSFQWGYIAWPDEKSKQVDPHGEVMVPIARDMPIKETLPQPPDGRGWEQQRSVDMVGLTDEAAGVAMQYKQSSKGAMKFFLALTNEVLSRAADPNEKAIVPIIKLGSKPYDHKKFGLTYNPTFEIVEWRALDDATPPKAAASTAAGTDADGEETDADLEAEYKREEAAKAAQPDIPRRRQRRG